MSDFHSPHRLVEFQAVILAAGKGHYLYPLTEKISKPLLPVANRPLISYPLSLLENAGFTDVIIITTQAAQPAIKHMMTEKYGHRIRPHFKIVDEKIGSVRALLQAKDMIKTDFFVLSTDTITAVPLQVLADSHRIHQSTVTMLLRDKHVEEKAQSSSKKAESNSDDADYLAYEASTNRIAFIQNADQIQTEEIMIPSKILQKMPNLVFNAKTQDMHVYIFSRWVLDLIEMNQRLDSIRLHLIPYLVKKQFSNFNVPGNRAKLPESAFANKDSLVSNWTHLQSFRDSLGEVVKCYGHITKEGVSYRVNTPEVYFETIRDLSKVMEVYPPWENIQPAKDKVDKYVDQTVDLHQRSTIGPECVVGANTKIGERSSVKKSTIGPHCVIGNNVKITNSIIMSHVRIQDGCTITGTIICNDSSIQEKCSLKDCQIGTSCTVEAETDLKNESLVQY